MISTKRLTPDMVSIINQLENELKTLSNEKKTVKTYLRKTTDTEKRIEALKTAYIDLENGMV